MPLLLTSVVSYRDHELASTLISLVTQCDEARALRLCVVVQNDSSETNLGDLSSVVPIFNSKLGIFDASTPSEPLFKQFCDQAKKDFGEYNLTLMPLIEAQNDNAHTESACFGPTHKTVVTFEAHCDNRLVYVRLPAHAARGPWFARSICQLAIMSLWPVHSTGDDDTPFYLQLDSHMRFAPSWDSFFIDQLRHCEKTGHRRSVLSTYPPPYPSGMGSTDFPKERVNSLPILMCGKHWNAGDHLLRVSGRRLKEERSIPIPSLFWAAGMSFSRALVLKDCPYNIDEMQYVFFGEEHVMWVRLFDNGYSFFAPGKSVVFHLWKRERPFFLSDPENSINRGNASDRSALTALRAEALTRLAPLKRPRGDALNASSAQHITASTTNSTTAHDVSCGKSSKHGYVNPINVRRFWDFVGVDSNNGDLSCRVCLGGSDDEAHFLDSTNKNGQGLPALLELGAHLPPAVMKELMNQIN
eukprot:GHVN01060271.1.p1 GENE.GHVN01060271.1~~GHVN01060271.1.p1  ORF type:complete len:471 (+),score=48.73 GHVN01060271.1:35-1447(+)